MTEPISKTNFVSGVMQLYPQVRQVGGSILIDGENRTQANDDDPPGFKPSFLLGQDLFTRASRRPDPSTLLDEIAKAIKDAQRCSEIQKDPLTRDPTNANCRPVMSVDLDGSLTIQWER